jgi:Tfp pilus assembly protein PilZ
MAQTRGSMKLCKVATTCASRTEFVRAFSPFVDAFTIFVPASLPLKIGRRVQVAVSLTDETVVFRADGEVLDILADAQNRFGCAGVRFRLSDLGRADRVVHDQLLRARAARAPNATTRPTDPGTLIARAAVVDPPIDEDAPTTELAVPPRPPAVQAKVEPAPLLAAATPHPQEATPPPAPPRDRLPSEVLEIPRSYTWRSTGLPVATAALAGIMGIAIWRGAGRPRVPPPVAVAVAAAAAPPAAAAPATALAAQVTAPRPPAPREPAVAPPAAVDPVEDPTALGTEANPVAGEPVARCTARITSAPAGATVSLGSEKLGRTPLKEIVLPCGAHTLIFNHPRYATARVPVSASATEPATVAARLARPTAKLEVVSTPTRATVRVNGRAVGHTPLKVPLPRYERVEIEASAPGQKVWRKTIYLNTPVTKLSARLTR